MTELPAGSIVCGSIEGRSDAFARSSRRSWPTTPSAPMPTNTGRPSNYAGRAWTTPASDCVACRVQPATPANLGLRSVAIEMPGWRRQHRIFARKDPPKALAPMEACESCEFREEARRCLLSGFRIACEARESECGSRFRIRMHSHGVA